MRNSFEKWKCRNRSEVKEDASEEEENMDCREYARQQVWKE